MKHLTAADRGKIETLLQEKYSKVEIAKRLGKSPSTIGREIRKGLDGTGKYLAWIAQVAYEANRKRCRQVPKLDKLENHNLRSKVVEGLQKGWDPAQIAGRLKAERYKLRVCSETIYEWIYTSDWSKTERLYQYLRLGRKKRTKQTGRKAHCCKIPNRISIHERPAVVNKKVRFGDWEGDSVIYAHKRAINTLNERVTSFVCLTKLSAKTAKQTVRAVTKQLRDKLVYTLTFDNGTEFAWHEQISNSIDCSIFFADPYSSCQRGANENLNRQLRAYLPKRTSIENLTQAELDNIAWELNNKPRQRLNWHTPQECFDWCCQHPGEPLQLGLVAFGSRI